MSFALCKVDEADVCLLRIRGVVGDEQRTGVEPEGVQRPQDRLQLGQPHREALNQQELVAMKELVEGRPEGDVRQSPAVVLVQALVISVQVNLKKKVIFGAQVK